MVTKILFGIGIGVILVLSFNHLAHADFPGCNGDKECTSTDDCQKTYCKGNPSCTASCDGYKPNIRQCGTCKWTVGNTCKKEDWGDWGPCVNFCQTRTCTNNGHPYDLEVQSCGGGECIRQGGGLSCPNGPYVWECQKPHSEKKTLRRKFRGRPVRLR